MTVKANTSLTQVRPVNPVEEAHNGLDDGEALGLRVLDKRQTVDSMEGKTLLVRAVRLQFGASSKEYMAATERVQEAAQESLCEQRGKGTGLSVIITVALILGATAMCVQGSSQRNGSRW